MSVFSERLKQLQPNPENRRWLYMPYDQLSDEIGPLSKEDPASLGIILIENTWKAARRPYHKQKLALILANMRHFALEQAERGVAVRYEVTDGPYYRVLQILSQKLGAIRVMEPAERELRKDLQAMFEAGDLQMLPHEGWLTTSEDFLKSQKGKTNRWRMDAFYRYVRKKSGILMDGEKPVGGKYSFDTENRRPWSGEPAAAEPPTFEIDAIKEEVGRLISSRLDRHPGRLDLASLPATQNECETFWSWAKESCLPHFGPYEDAMSEKSTTIFHTRISALMNIHRLLPGRIIEDILDLDLPLQSKEGFLRQILGWREFIRHVHVATDGFRKISIRKPTVAKTIGDGGYERWSGNLWRDPPVEEEGGAIPAELGAETPLPPVYWGAKSGLNCLDHVVETVWEEGYSHHITRLMILSNIATLLDVSPRELTDWFWVAYIDAFDWVVESNVLGMGTFALGDLMSTKPYVSGAAYIDKMSDYCQNCRFDPKGNCPITHLYWAFLERHKKALRDNPRMRLIISALDRRAHEKRTLDRRVFEFVRKKLVAGQKLESFET
ncbi:cryptochrome/photolyase family protein [bacterium]|nr:cryptochrome/photolyase family protein [bacterium]